MMSMERCCAISAVLLVLFGGSCSQGTKHSPDAPTTDVLSREPTASLDGGLSGDDSNYEPDSAAEPTCIGSCETKFFWARLIVGFSPSDGTTASWMVSGRYEDGSVLPGIKSGCPAGVLTVPCSFSLPAMASTSEITVRVEDPATGMAAETTVTLQPYNRCGRNIVYVQVSPDGNGGIGFGPPYVISPCSTP